MKNFGEGWIFFIFEKLHTEKMSGGGSETYEVKGIKACEMLSFARQSPNTF